MWPRQASIQVLIQQARSLILEWGGSLFSVGGPRAMCAKSAVGRGVWGHAPQEIF